MKKNLILRPTSYSISYCTTDIIQFLLTISDKIWQELEPELEPKIWTKVEPEPEINNFGSATLQFKGNNPLNFTVQVKQVLH